MKKGTFMVPFLLPDFSVAWHGSVEVLADAVEQP